MGNPSSNFNQNKDSQLLLQNHQPKAHKGRLDHNPVTARDRRVSMLLQRQTTQRLRLHTVSGSIVGVAEGTVVGFEEGF